MNSELVELSKNTTVVTLFTGREYDISPSQDDTESSILGKLALSRDGETIKLFNPFHDRLGRFAARSGGGGGNSGSSTGGSKSSEDIKTTTVSKASKLGKIVKTTGKVLGLGTLGLVGLAVVASIASSGDDDIQPGDSLGGIGNDTEDVEAKRQEIQSQIDELTKSWPKFSNEQEAVDFTMAEFRRLGFEMPENISISIGGTPSGTGGYYDPNLNKLVVNPRLAEDIVNGSPLSMWALVHEVAHSNQESGENGWGDNSQLAPGDSSLKSYQSFFEGQNDLATAIAISSMYNSPMTQDKAVQDGNQYNSLIEQMNSLDFFNREMQTQDGGTMVVGQPMNISGSSTTSTSSIGYETESLAWAAVATLASQKSGTDPITFLAQQHNNGFDPASQHQVLMSIFPDQMTSRGYYKETGGFLGFGGSTEISFPPSHEIAQWARENGLDPEEAFFMIINSAAGM